ncbi:MAG: DinB family protein [Ginsengibacter sp.]
MARPNITDYPEYFGLYIKQVPEDNLNEALINQSLMLPGFLKSISEEKSEYAYAAGKWSIKELLQHLIDAERIFNYRALCIARRETISLPGFDENTYATNSNGKARKWQSLIDEFMHLRRSTEDLYLSFTEEMLGQKGLSNNNTVTPLSFGFITIGHFYHHKRIIEERYL